MTESWILDFLNRRAKVEQEMLDAAKRIGYRPIDADQLRDWALRLGVPEDPGFGRAVAESERYAMVRCGNCGPQYLTRKLYNEQMQRPNSTWRCPQCAQEADWSDDFWEEEGGGREPDATPPASPPAEPLSLDHPTARAALAGMELAQQVSPPDVQNVPDVWAIIESYLSELERPDAGYLASPEGRLWVDRVRSVLVQRDRFVLVPKEATPAMLQAMDDEYEAQIGYQAMLAAAPTPEWKQP